MSRNTNVVPSSRVQCTRCSRYHFRGTPCRCTKRSPVYFPRTDGVVPNLAASSDHHREPDVYVTARHHRPLDPDGNWSSVGGAVDGDEL